MKILFNFGYWLVILTGIFYITYNSFYGWNIEPIDEIETTFDTISKFGFNIGMILFLIPLWQIYGIAVEKLFKDKEVEKQRKAYDEYFKEHQTEIITADIDTFLEKCRLNKDEKITTSDDSYWKLNALLVHYLESKINE